MIGGDHSQRNEHAVRRLDEERWYGDTKREDDCEVYVERMSILATDDEGKAH